MARWFKDSEFDCGCGCGENNISPDLVMLLDEARTLAKVPFVINSGYRCDWHNKCLLGKPKSAHLTGLAADIATPTAKMRFAILQALFAVGFNRIFPYKSKKFVHVDIDQSKPSNVLTIY